MGSSRSGGLRAVVGQVAKDPNRELTTQEQARRDWIKEQRGVDSITEKPRMAGGIPGILGMMSRAQAQRRGGYGRRDKATRDWIDQQRGVEIQKDDDKSSTLRNLFGIRTTADRQRYQDRNAWIDEQIRKSKEEKTSFTPLTQQERRDTISEENFKLKDIWDR